MGTGTVMNDAIYHQTITSDAYAVCKEVGHIIETLAVQYHLNDDQCFDVKVILCELLQNAIRHGNAMDHAKLINLGISMDIEKNMLEITVADEGSGFNVPQTIKKKRRKALETDDVLDMDEFGRGLLIVKTLCDDVHYNHRGNQVTVKKAMVVS